MTYKAEYALGILHGLGIRPYRFRRMGVIPLRLILIVTLTLHTLYIYIN